MNLYKIYKGNIKTMCNTPCKIAVFTNGKEIKVFQKEYFTNNYGLSNWSRNIILERKYQNIKQLNERLIL